MAGGLDIEKRIGALVRTLRHADGLTQDDIGNAIGVSHQQIQKYESGQNRIAISTLIRLAKALGTTAAEFVAEIDVET